MVPTRWDVDTSGARSQKKSHFPGPPALCQQRRGVFLPAPRRDVQAPKLSGYVDKKGKSGGVRPVSSSSSSTPPAMFACRKWVSAGSPARVQRSAAAAAAVTVCLHPDSRREMPDSPGGTRLHAERLFLLPHREGLVEQECDASKVTCRYSCSESTL